MLQEVRSQYGRWEPEKKSWKVALYKQNGFILHCLSSVEYRRLKEEKTNEESKFTLYFAELEQGLNRFEAS